MVFQTYWNKGVSDKKSENSKGAAKLKGQGDLTGGCVSEADGFA